jgi:hypothetical protein
MLRLQQNLLVALGMSALSVACGGTHENAGNTNQNQNQGDDGGSVSGDTFAPGAADPCKTTPNTTYPNNDLCIEPPPPSMGFQIHFGPSDYSNPDEVKKFVLDPGAEGVLCEAVHTPNSAAVFSQEQHVRTRQGTHHIIYWRQSPGQQVSPPADGTLADGCRGGGYVFFMGSEAALSSKGGKLDVPLPGAKGQVVSGEEAGYAQEIQPNMSVWIETHFVNTTTQPLLREAWANVIYFDQSKVTKILDPIFWIGGLAEAVPPHQRAIVPAATRQVQAHIGEMQSAPPPTSGPAPSGPVALMGIAGHAHAHTVRETVWVTHGDGTETEVYQAMNWEEPLFAQFDDVHSNPPVADGQTGAFSGPLVLNPTDSVRWECEVNNTLDNVTLVFADRAYDAEMCNVFGYYVPGNGGAWNELSAMPQKIISQ